MNIVGISAYYHDSAACLVQDGKIIFAAQEERFTRKKHDDSFPTNALRAGLKHTGLDASDIDYVAFYDKPLLKFERILETYLAFAPAGLKSFSQAIPLWVRKKLWIKELLKSELSYKGEVIFPEHHESHAAAAFFPSPYSEAAFLTMDGVGEWATTSFGVGRGNQLQMIADIRFPHSLGLLYSAFTYYTGFRVNSGEYKVMGLAPYGEPAYKDLILKELIDVKEDGSFRMNMDYFNYCAGLTMTNERFHRLLGGPPRKPETALTQREMDLARSIQDVTEEVVFRMARHVRKETGMRHLCLAGGVALNCVANGKLLRERVFDDIWIQPAAGDAGGAVGAALFTWHEYLGNERVANGRDDFMFGALLGPEFGNGEIGGYLRDNGIVYREIPIDEIPLRVAELLANEKVVGWFHGRMEFGPRALGARSIIGDARSPRMQETLNLKIKFRESFRPLAPSVLSEKAHQYFDIDRPSPYMLLVADVVEAKRRTLTGDQEGLFGLDKLYVTRSDIPAVTHVDYSARVQTVHRETNPLYHKMLSRFDEMNGCPVIVNTSFNVRGEPIVCTPDDAYQCFMRTDMDYLVMENYLLDKAEQKPLADEAVRRREFEPD
jgi:carbamoyltransferase